MMHALSNWWHNRWLERRNSFARYHSNDARDACITNGAGVTICNSRIRGRLDIGEMSRLDHVDLSGNISIGHASAINGPATVVRAKHHPLQIGHYTSIAHNVTIIDHQHQTQTLSTAMLAKRISGAASLADTVSGGPISIGSDVWIAAGVVVTDGVSIGNGAVIGANCVVTHDVPSYAVVAGVPARLIRMRFDQSIIDALTAWRWFEYPLAALLSIWDDLHRPLTLELIDSMRRRADQHTASCPPR